MAVIGNWNGHSFTVSSSLIRGIQDLMIKGACETTTKNSDNQKYEERKYGESIEFSLTVELNALVGVTDVRNEAMTFVSEASAGACSYFYLGTGKLVPAKVMLKSAQVAEIVTMPGNTDQWISCFVDLSFVQGSKNDGSGTASSSPTSGSKKATTKTSGTTSDDRVSIGAALGIAATTAALAKAGSALTKTLSTAGLSYQETKAVNTKSTTTTKNSGGAVSPTTGRPIVQKAISD